MIGKMLSKEVHIAAGGKIALVKFILMTTENCGGFLSVFSLYLSLPSHFSYLNNESNVLSLKAIYDNE